MALRGRRVRGAGARGEPPCPPLPAPLHGRCPGRRPRADRRLRLRREPHLGGGDRPDALRHLPRHRQRHGLPLRRVRRHARRELHGVGAAGPGRLRRGRLERVGRPREPNAAAIQAQRRLRRDLGALHPLRAHPGLDPGRRPLWLPDPDAGWRHRRPDRPVRPGVRVPADRHRPRPGHELLQAVAAGRRLPSGPLPVGRQRVARGARRPQAEGRPAGAAHGRLRGPPALLEAHGDGRLRELPRPRAPPPGARAEAALQLRRAHRPRAPPLQRLLGLPGLRVLRMLPPARLARRLQVPCGHAPQGRHRHHHGLRARALLQGLVLLRPLRWHGDLRVRGPARGRAEGLGDEGLQLEEERGPELPHRRRALLGGAVPHRRLPLRRRLQHGLPELLHPERLQAGGRVGAQRAGQQREPGGGLLPARPQRGHAGVPPGRRHDRRGVPCLGRCHRGGGGALQLAWLRPEVGPRLDERHPHLHEEALREQARLPREAGQPAAADREVGGAALPRRVRDLQGQPHGQDGHRGEPGLLRQAEDARRALRLPGGVHRQAAALHGRRDRAGQVVGREALRGLARGQRAAAGPALHLGLGPHGRLPAPQGSACRRRLPRVGELPGEDRQLRVGGEQPWRMRARVHAVLGEGATRAGHLQLQQPRAPQLRHVRALLWRVRGPPQLRRLALRRARVRPGEHGQAANLFGRLPGLVRQHMAESARAELHAAERPGGPHELQVRRFETLWPRRLPRSRGRHVLQRGVHRRRCLAGNVSSR
mmetsp:Transcript_84475/g.182031  ORF Transcript_84475/g.182031 Transcript_84475/m.182031 type:complete len:764 (+) Transcript_84475:366-2657(+)